MLRSRDAGAGRRRDALLPRAGRKLRDRGPVLWRKQPDVRSRRCLLHDRRACHVPRRQRMLRAESLRERLLLRRRRCVVRVGWRVLRRDALLLGSVPGLLGKRIRVLGRSRLLCRAPLLDEHAPHRMSSGRAKRSDLRRSADRSLWLRAQRVTATSRSTVLQRQPCRPDDRNVLRRTR